MKQRGNQIPFPVGQWLLGNFNQIFGNILLHLVDRIFIKGYLIPEPVVVGGNTFLRFFKHFLTYIQHYNHFLDDRLNRQVGCYK